jgi:hypothetical protein
VSLLDSSRDFFSPRLKAGVYFFGLFSPADLF